MPKISVIVPVYKAEPYLRRCVDSILAQTFTDFELILVDDGSPDNCSAICDEYAAKDARIQVIHKENGGPSSARNAGLERALGEYIYFCDSDDSIEEKLFETAVKYLPLYDMVVFNFRRVDEAGQPLGWKSHFHPGATHWGNTKEKFLFLYGAFFDFAIGFGNCYRFFKSSIIAPHQLTFADSIFLAEDMLFDICYLLHSHSFYCMEGVFYNYTVRSDSIMGVESTRYNIGRMNELGKALLQHILESSDTETAGLCFPIVYLGVMNNVVTRIRENNPMISVRRLRSIIQSDLGDPGFFLEQIDQLSDHRNELREAYGWRRAKVLLAEYQYYTDGKILRYCFHALPWRLWVFAARWARRIGKLIRITAQRTKPRKTKV